MKNIRKAKTPALIHHGEKDRRVPPANSYELYRGLRDAGVEARLMVYAGFGHGITKPKSNRAVLQHDLDWFSHYLWSEPIPKESPLNGSGAGDQRRAGREALERSIGYPSAIVRNHQEPLS